MQKHRLLKSTGPLKTRKPCAGSFLPCRQARRLPGAVYAACTPYTSEQREGDQGRNSVRFSYHSFFHSIQQPIPLHRLHAPFGGLDGGGGGVGRDEHGALEQAVLRPGKAGDLPPRPAVGDLGNLHPCANAFRKYRHASEFFHYTAVDRRRQHNLAQPLDASLF